MTKRPLDLEPVDSATIATLAGKVSTLACWVFIASIFSAIISLRCLYGDGSFQLTETLKAGNFVAVAMNRDCASYIFQLPVVTALKLGCNNLYLLQLAFGVGCFVPWLIALMFCYQMAPRNFWLAMIGCGFGYLNASFMPVGEYIIAHAFFWPILFAVLFVRPLKPLAAGMMLISALILVYSYESLLFLGPALALVAAERLLGKGEKGWARIVFAVTTGLLLCAAWIALGGVLHPDCPGNFGGFKRGLKWMFFNPTWTMGWSFIWLFMLGILCVGRQSFTKRYFKLELALVGMAMAIWGLWPLFDPENLSVERQYESRPMQLLVPFGLLIIARIMISFPRWFEARRHYLVAFSASLLLAQSAWHLTATWQWNGFLGTWRGMLASRSGLITLSETHVGSPSLQGQCLRFDWNWANPTLSLMLAPEGKVRAVALPRVKPIWQPFDPFNVAAYPRLERYGIDYSEFTNAVQKQKLRPIRP